ncbi:MAG: hypothetical protein ACRCWF_17925 [Beijerinckiaceae bacterium]
MLFKIIQKQANDIPLFFAVDLRLNLFSYSYCQGERAFQNNDDKAGIQKKDQSAGWAVC